MSSPTRHGPLDVAHNPPLANAGTTLHKGPLDLAHNPGLAGAFKHELSLTIPVHQKANDRTLITLEGKGFTPRQPVRLSIMFEPGKAVPAYEIQTLPAKADGSFTWPYDARFIGNFADADPSANTPAFVALDVTTGKSAIAEAEEYWWYA